MSRIFKTLYQVADVRTPAKAREVALRRTLEALRQPRQEEDLLEQAIPTTEKKNANRLEILCQELRSQQRLEDAAAPGIVPETQRPAAFFSGENFQLVRRLFLAAGDEAPRAVVFCTVEQGNARNWIGAQVAELLTYHTNSSVCIVDADVANPSLHTYFGVENAEGLARAVLGRGSVQEFARPVGPSGLHLISAGALPPGADSSSLLSSGRLDARISELRARFGYLVVNGPPATGNCVAAYLAAITDGVILVVEPSFSPRQAAREAKENIEAAGGRLLGAVLWRRALLPSSRMASPRTPTKPGHTS
jgi:Mrp family chromosome partitioning ATPase